MGATNRDDWDSHWKEYSEGASFNPAQEYRRRLIVKLLGLRGSGSGVRLLDIGSGQGDLAAEIRASFPGAEIMGLELSHSGVEISRSKVPDARFVQCNLLEQTEPPADLRHWATHAVCSEVIEHVDDPVRLLSSAREYMRPECMLALTAPGGPMSAFDKHIGHRKHFRPDEIVGLLQQAGYRAEFAGKAGFPFFNLYRCAVILRGQKLVEDISVGNNSPGTRMARFVMSVFHLLFRVNLQASPWGWQMIAKAMPLSRSNNG